MSSPRPHVPIWKRVLKWLGILLVIYVVVIVYSFFRAWQLVPESYAAWSTSTMMVEYLKTHTNQWPQGWEDLRYMTNMRGVYLEFDRLPQLVKIDWQADVGRLRQVAHQDANARVLVVTRLNGSRLRTIWGEDTEPNRAIMSYLRTQ
jgi:hypothetical protein